MSSKGLKVVIQNVELVDVAVMSVDLLQLGLVKGLVPGLVQVVASLAEYDMDQVGYYLDEAKGWSLDVSELERAYNAAKDKSDVKAIVVINPGNPTGQVQNRDNIEAVIKFAAEKKLFVFADEVMKNSCTD